MRIAHVVIGLGFGDEGKGSIVDSLTHHLHADLVVRFNGGSQALHHVVLDDGSVHAFSQFGSGSFAGAKTHLSRFMLFDPLAYLREAEVHQLQGLSNVLGLVSIDPNALVITPAHVFANRARERARGLLGRHGSCGMGIGECRRMADKMPDITIHAHELSKPKVLKSKVMAQVSYFASIFGSGWMKGTDLEFIAKFTAVSADAMPRLCGDWDALAKHHVVVFEGAQGVLLDQDYGFDPYTTWSRTTFENANELILAHAQADVRRYGVIRTYGTRHGNGPFPGEGRATWAPMTELNGDGEFQGGFRVGAFDLDLFDYAKAVVRDDFELVLTHLDTVFGETGAIRRPRQLPFRVHWPAQRELQRVYNAEILTPMLMTDHPKMQMVTVGDLTRLLNPLGRPMIVSRGPLRSDKARFLPEHGGKMVVDIAST